MSDPLCGTCRGVTPCSPHGDPGPLATYPRREIPSAAFMYGVPVLGLYLLGVVYLAWWLYGR